MNEEQRHNQKIAKFILIPIASILCFIGIELGYRLIDPFSYINPHDFNITEHGNLSEHDPLLGWRGVPGGKANFTTENISIILEHNEQGFRDIDHDQTSSRPAIVFLGDSFTWGYEIEFENMFANILRDKLPDYEIFNLSHRGYGTDQEFLVFKDWKYRGPIKTVVLMFSDNDIYDTNADKRYSKPKPKYIIEDNELILTGVPVPKVVDWRNKHHSEHTELNLGENLKLLALRSHFLHDLYYRYKIYKYLKSRDGKFPEFPNEDPTLTLRVLLELKYMVEQRGAELVVFFIPARQEIEGIENNIPYQNLLMEYCKKTGIRCIDLAPEFEIAWQRTYYRHGTHWNKNGNRLAADIIYKNLTNNPDLDLRK